MILDLNRPALNYLLLVAAAVCAAVGQTLFKLGASNRTSLASLINATIAFGIGFYLLGTILWIVALRKLPLSSAYPFTAVTFILVYLASAAFLGEKLTAGGIVGSVIVLLGLALILWSNKI